VVLVAFVGMVALWASAATLKLDSTAVAFLGLGCLLASGVLTLEDIRHEGDVLATFIWFAVLFTLSGQLNELGFMGFSGNVSLTPWADSAVAAGLALIGAHVLLHYVFVSQTAHLLALFGVFLDVGVAGRPGRAACVSSAVCDELLSAITPQGSSANLLFAGSGYLSQRDLYRLGIDDCEQSADSFDHRNALFRLVLR
jgi:DASS family divalent anion:Na+ symporter